MSEAEEDDRFTREFKEAVRVAGVNGSMEPYARVLSGRLRQMDKRARAANSRADRIEAKCDRMEDALRRIKEWSEAYPLEAFPAPDWKRSNEVLDAAGLSLSRISAANMRYVGEGVGKIARAALAETSPAPTPTVIPDKGEEG